MFITLEGGEGSGKSTLVTRLSAALSARGATVFVSREPGGVGVTIAEEIRKVLLDPANVGMDAWTEALLYAASRREHVEKAIRPALSRGEVVLLDRYLDSSLAYQGHARGLGIERVRALNEGSTGGLMPDLTLFLDLPPSVGLARVARYRADKDDRLDREALSFHEKVREGYLLLAREEPERIVTIDATATPDDVYSRSLSAILARMKP